VFFQLARLLHISALIAANKKYLHFKFEVFFGTTSDERYE